MTHGVHLLTYADRMGGTIDQLGALLKGPLRSFNGVHILPFFVPFDGADSGFDPVNHCQVDPRLGTWESIQTLNDLGVCVTADAIVNHMSADSPEFQDWLANGNESEFDGLFLTFDTVFPQGGTEESITKFYRPRAGLPFTPYRQADGTRCLVWTTFMSNQVDIDVTHPAGWRYLEKVISTLAAGGVKIVRIDAVGYAIKTVGTDSFMTEHTLEFVSDLTALAHRFNMKVLVEVHAHYSQQLAIAQRTDLVYDFATPPLLLHSLVTEDTSRLVHWLNIRPDNAVTVLDTHDGIGIIDAGPIGERSGLINSQEMGKIFAWVAQNTHGRSTRASVIPAWNTQPHQINTTFFDALGANPETYLLCRIVQFFTPGIPQVYYVGLLAGHDDIAEFEATGEGRAVNRHRYTDEELYKALETEVVQALLVLVHLRSTHPAFAGEFHYSQPKQNILRLGWNIASHEINAEVDVADRTFTVSWTAPDTTMTTSSVAELAALHSQIPHTPVETL